MVRRICISDESLEKISKALENGEKCPAQEGEGGIIYCRYGEVVGCEHKGPEVQFDSGILCEINTQYVCNYRVAEAK